MKVVLDTNVFIAALISDKGVPHKVYQAWLEGKFTLVTSSWQIAEFRRVSRYDRVRLTSFPQKQVSWSTA